MKTLHSNFYVQINIPSIANYFSKYYLLHKKINYINFNDLNYEEDYTFESKLHSILKKELIEYNSKNTFNNFISLQYYIKENYDCEINFDDIEDYYYDDSEYYDYHFDNINYHYLDFDSEKDDFSYLKTFFMSKHHLWQMEELNQALNNLELNIISEILSHFKAKQTFKNTFLIEIEYFEKFIDRYKYFPFINWGDISKNEYYPWTIDIIKNAQFILDWKELVTNKNTLKILTENRNDNFDYFFELNEIDINDYIKEKSYRKKIFIIKEYSGNLNEYFRFKNFLNSEITKKLSENGEILINWLDSYVTPFDIMNQEKLIFDIKDYDFVLLLEKEKELSRNCQIVYDFFVENKIKIHSNINELFNS